MGHRKIEEVEEKGDVHLCKPWNETEYNEWKFNIEETDPEDSDVIKDLDWDTTHRQWDEDMFCWTADLDSFFVVLTYFQNEGYEVTFGDELIQAYGNNTGNSREKELDDDL